MNQSHWFEWNPATKKPAAINQMGRIALAAPIVCFILFVISIALTQTTLAGKDWIMDSCFGLFAVSFAFKAYALLTKTKGFGKNKEK